MCWCVGVLACWRFADRISLSHGLGWGILACVPAGVPWSTTTETSSLGGSKAQIGGLAAHGSVLAAARSWFVFQSFLVVCCVLLLSPPIHVGLFVVWFIVPREIEYEATPDSQAGLNDCLLGICFQEGPFLK